ncbi:hypothetical protein [Mucilaginibacter sp. UR6-11]|uniref:hypothetical protein n=1 Tax=Mucilaginibacter sp. UR6-11 TaxID=1435644 RepID=UPI001E402B48|nr:hypothetical protein [Mucilaginibacter sp. UR6-11]MCC8424518.1 hypothetical protein [Mucilaginibacter sp. UR6-11]
MKNLILLIVLCLATNIVLFAQETTTKKLGTVQATNLRAPSPIKIDGKLGDWNNNFQAYNKNTRLLYLLANDDRNIYLVAKSTDFTTTAKIIAGGISLTINTEGKKKEKDAYNVTFPIIEHPERLAGGLGNRFGNRNAGADTELMKAVHERTIIAAKQIKVLGFKNITDTLISIYNEYSIKAAINFDADGSLTFELAIPLKSLDLFADTPKEVAYQIMLNGLQINDGRGPQGGGGPPGGGGGRNALDFMDLVSPSYFWGKYTIAKKQ